MVSDANADDFIERTTHRIFEDTASGRPAWQEMEAGAVKHDTFVYSRTGDRVLFWDNSDSATSFSEWATDIRAAVVAEGK